jgi:hypothetical protein
MRLVSDDIIDAYTDFRKAFSRVQRAHINARNWIRRDSGLSQDLVDSERQDLADEIIEADAKLLIAEDFLEYTLSFSQ